MPRCLNFPSSISKSCDGCSWRFWQWISTLHIPGIPQPRYWKWAPNTSACSMSENALIPGYCFWGGILFNKLFIKCGKHSIAGEPDPFILSNISDCWSMAPSGMHWSIIHDRNASLHESSLLPVTGMRWQPLTHLFDSAFSLPKLLKLLLLGWAFVSLLLGRCMVGRVQPRHIGILRTRNPSWIGGGIPDTSLLQLVKWKLSSKCPRNVTLTMPLPRICSYKQKCHV